MTGGGSINNTINANINLMDTYAIKKESNAVAIFFICTLATALSGFLSGYFGGEFTKFNFDEGVVASIYAIICAISGFALFSILTAPTKNRTLVTIKNWAIVLWFSQFFMFLSAPFFGGTLGYLWFSLISAMISAIAVLCFKLRFAGAIALLPVLAWIIFSSYTALLAV